MLEIPVHCNIAEWINEYSDNAIIFTLHQRHYGCKKMLLWAELLILAIGIAHSL